MFARRPVTLHHREVECPVLIEFAPKSAYDSTMDELYPTGSSPAIGAVSRIEMLARLRAASALVGQQIRVKPHDEIVSADITPAKISVLIRRIAIREYRYQTAFDRAELWLAVWVRSDTGWRAAGDPIVIPDPDFRPYRRQEIGEVQNRPSEYQSRREWERMCIRPGNNSRLGQRDSFYRALDGYDREPLVRDIWAADVRQELQSSSDD